MQKKALAAMTAVGVAAAIAIPTIAFGNARSDVGSLSFQRVANTPQIAKLSGGNEVPPGDPDGSGAAAVTVDIIDSLKPLGAELCWDVTYTKVTGTPTVALHAGGPTANNPPAVPFPAPGASSATGCANISPTLGNQILDTPENFYVNVATTDFPNGAIRGQLSAGPPPAGEAHLLASPLRAYDSRDSAGPKLSANETRVISLANG